MDENLVLKTHQETTDDPITDQQFHTACIIVASGLTGIVTGLVTGLIFKHRLKRRLELENIHKKRELDLMEKRLKEQEEMVGISFQEDFLERFQNYMKGE